MLVGMVAGYLIISYANISKQILYFILAGFVLLFTVIGCYTTFIKKEKKEEVDETQLLDNQDQASLMKEPIYKVILWYALLVVAGVVHGMYVCGGPLLIIYATKKLKDKDEFRSTLSMVWVVLNIVNLVRDILFGNFVTGDPKMTFIVLAMALGVLTAAVAIGNLIAKRLNRKTFMIITYVLMAISAISLILNACGVF